MLNAAAASVCLKVGGGTQKPDLAKAIHKRRTHVFGGESVGRPPSPEKKLNLGFAGMQFPAVLRGLFALFSLSISSITFSVAPNPIPPSLFLRKFG